MVDERAEVPFHKRLQALSLGEFLARSLAEPGKSMREADLATIRELRELMGRPVSFLAFESDYSYRRLREQVMGWLLDECRRQSDEVIELVGDLDQNVDWALRTIGNGDPVVFVSQERLEKFAERCAWSVYGSWKSRRRHSVDTTPSIRPTTYEGEGSSASPLDFEAARRRVRELLANETEKPFLYACLKEVEHRSAILLRFVFKRTPSEIGHLLGLGDSDIERITAQALDELVEVVAVKEQRTRT